MTRPPMTAEEARENVAAMRSSTKADARVRVMKLALRIGNLSPEARLIYARELAAINATGDA